MKLFCVFAIVVVVSTVDGFLGAPNKPPVYQHPLPHHKQAPQQRPLPRYYSDKNPHIIASPRPLSPATQHYPHHHNPNHPASYRTLNPGSHVAHRSARSDPHQHPPQLLASASNTPVLVLKKDHARPILSSAVVAAAIAEKRAAQAEKAAQQPQQQQEKQIPTVIMERPGGQQEEKKEPEQPKPEHKEQEDESQQMSLEHDELSVEEPEETVNSAERRMFFNSVNENVQHAQHVSGPQGPSSHRPQPPKLSHHASASSMQSTRSHHRPINPVHHPEMEEEHPIERIVRSNTNNPYNGGSLAFEYPPPQSNYIAQGPTRVPVKYQQGVIGVKPAHHQHAPHHGHPKQQQQQPRPYRQRIQQQQQQQERGAPGSEEPLSEELEEEEAQPDKLQELLATSKFSCDGKKDGYYADDTLNCEVFHYCQGGKFHSWLCPDTFVFHQIHLICVPPSPDNICKQSANYHFVNDYLYRPVNEKEAEGTNISLKYADRFFPDGYSNGAGDILLPYHNEEEDDEDVPRRPQHHQAQQHVQNPYSQHHQQQPRPRPNPIPQQHHAQPPYNPYASHSPRPSQTPYISQGGFVPSPQVHPQQQQRHAQQPQRHQQPYAQQRSGTSVHPHQVLSSKLKQQPHPHHHHGSSSKHHSSSSSNPGVFYTPESINIPLQQRRPIPNPHPNHNPQIFRPSPQVHKSSGKESNRRKLEDDDYEY